MNLPGLATGSVEEDVPASAAPPPPPAVGGLSPGPPPSVEGRITAEKPPSSSASLSASTPLSVRDAATGEDDVIGAVGVTDEDFVGESGEAVAEPVGPVGVVVVAEKYPVEAAVGVVVAAGPLFEGEFFEAWLRVAVSGSKNSRVGADGVKRGPGRPPEGLVLEAGGRH